MSEKVPKSEETVYHVEMLSCGHQNNLMLVAKVAEEANKTGICPKMNSEACKTATIVKSTKTVQSVFE